MKTHPRKKCLKMLYQTPYLKIVNFQVPTRVSLIRSPRQRIYCPAANLPRIKQLEEEDQIRAVSIGFWSVALDRMHQTRRSNRIHPNHRFPRLIASSKHLPPGRLCGYIAWNTRNGLPQSCQTHLHVARRQRRPCARSHCRFASQGGYHGNLMNLP